MSGPTRTLYDVGDVFVVGGQPTITYTARSDERVGLALAKYLATRPGKMLVITGPSKAGKTVLVSHGAPKAIHVSGGDIGSIEDFWAAVADKLPIWTTETAARAVTRQHESQNAIKGGIRTPIEFGGEHKESDGKAEALTHTEGRERPAAQRAKAELVEAKSLPIFLDDFHHIDPPVQKKIVRGLKDLTFKRVPIILAAVPHRVVDVVTQEREMKGRVDTHAVAPWTPDELVGIASAGFGGALHVACPDEIATRLARESFGSPHLMQDICLELAYDQGILQTVAEDGTVLGEPSNGWSSFFTGIAERNVVDDTYRSLKSGPRERSDRIPRPLKSGGTADTYALILNSISIALGRAVEDESREEPTTLTWTEIRPILNDVLVDKVPAWHEVKRALNKMHEIAKDLAMSANADDPYGSEPVLVFEPQKELVHITDPFFLFQLRWHK